MVSSSMFSYACWARRMASAKAVSTWSSWLGWESESGRSSPVFGSARFERMLRVRRAASVDCKG